MPPKASKTTIQQQKLLNARSIRSSKASGPKLTPEELLVASEEKVQMAEAEAAKLRSALECERQRSSKLEGALDQEIGNCTNLLLALSAERERSAKWYQALCVERRARQRGQARKLVLEDYIRLLQASDTAQSDELKDIKTNASKAIDALLKVEKENSSLRNELSGALERCGEEIKSAKAKVKAVGQELRRSRVLAAQLQKQCARAIAVREREVEKARQRIVKEKSVHTLLKKGVYTEETRNLIRLLVQAGCSQEYIGKVIHAIFRTAGISVIGDVSRRTVSRIVSEGYCAAQVQLGYEMQNTEGMFLCLNNSHVLIRLY
jgi:hypothetical protein